MSDLRRPTVVSLTMTWDKSQLLSPPSDGADDQDSVYADVAVHHPDAAVIVPPSCTAVLSDKAAPTQRDRHLQCIAEKGRMGEAAQGSTH